MPIPGKAEAKTAIRALQSSTAKIALDSAAKPRRSDRGRARVPISPDPAGAEERYINREQLRELIPASDMTLWRWQKDPEIAFPAPVKLGANGRNFWWLPTIRTWLRSREERRDLTRPAEE
jgi:predicted DNA-binding transcriptional regulator AlpA